MHIIKINGYKYILNDREYKSYRNAIRKYKRGKQIIYNELKNNNKCVVE